MNRFELEFETDNEAFDELAPEVSRILRELADKIESGRLHGKIYDANGNHIGGFLNICL
jgi:hypothetical protein